MLENNSSFVIQKWFQEKMPMLRWNSKEERYLAVTEFAPSICYTESRKTKKEETKIVFQAVLALDEWAQVQNEIKRAVFLIYPIFFIAVLTKYLIYT